MFLDVLPYSNLAVIDDAVWVLYGETGTGIYDFRFDQHFPCKHPREWSADAQVIARIGAVANYQETFDALLSDGMRLVHTPDEHRKCSELPSWYPVLLDLTPKSVWFDHIPEPDEVSACMRWPVFVKGARQTSHHSRSLSIIDGPESFRTVMGIYQRDSILRWQNVVCREFVPLRPVEESKAPVFDRIPSSFEFRTFWWRGHLVGFGPYWWDGKPYRITTDERRDAEAIAAEAAKRVAVPFLVVDVAQTMEGKWIIIECNDAQESGYAGVSPIGLWQNIITLEKKAAGER